MIKLLTDKTISLVRYGTGSIINLPAAIEAALIAEGAAMNFPVIARPVEVLASQSVAVACATTATDEVLGSFTIPAGTMGPNSILQIEPLWTFLSSGNNKIPKVKVAGVTIYTATRTTSVKEGPLIVLANRNSLAAQIMPYDNGYMTAGAGAPGTFTIDFSVPVTVEITGQRAAAEALALEYFRALHYVSD